MFYRKIIFLCLLFSISAMMGCTSMFKGDRINPGQEENLANMEEPLLVFHDGSGYYLLKSFMDTHPEVKIELENCISYSDDGIDIKKIINENGVPDLIIANGVLSAYLPEWYEEGYIAGLDAFCSNDTSIITDDYFPETFEIFMKDGNRYALPLGISMDFILTTESKYNNSAFVKLEEGYSGRELLNVMLEEVKKEKEADEFFSEMGIGILDYMYYLDGIKQTDEGIEMDEELFKLVYEFTYSREKEAGEVISLWTEQGKYFNNSTGYAFPGALEPRRYEGKFTASFGGVEDAPAVVLSYAETIYQYYCDEGIKAIYLPTADDGSRYQARVEVWGAIPEESRRKQLAYDLLRALMDEEINSFGTVRGPIPQDGSGETRNVYPINRENAISFLNRFESQTTYLVYGQSSATEYLTLLDRMDVSEKEKEKHKKMLSNISGLYCADETVYEMAEIFYNYYDAKVSDYKSCYLDMLNALNCNYDE